MPRELAAARPGVGGPKGLFEERGMFFKGKTRSKTKALLETPWTTSLTPAQQASRARVVDALRISEWGAIQLMITNM